MGRAALFLDRDGVLNVDTGYVSRREEFQWIDGAVDTIRLANILGLPCIIVTNQAGIGRGHYSESDFLALSDWMIAELAEQRAQVIGVYYCPYHPDGVGRYRHPDHPDRKPNPGMLLRAAADLRLDLRISAMVGDHETDILAGIRAGIRNLALFGNAPLGDDVRAVRVRTHSQVRAWLKGIAAAEAPMTD